MFENLRNGMKHETSELRNDVKGRKALNLGHFRDGIAISNQTDEDSDISATVSQKISMQFTEYKGRNLHIF